MDRIEVSRFKVARFYSKLRVLRIELRRYYPNCALMIRPKAIMIRISAPKSMVQTMELSYPLPRR